MRAGKERLQGSVNGDGFGVGWYDDAFARDPSEQLDEPCIFTSIQPAWNNLNLARLARKLRSPLLFAHVRAAYPGMPVFEGNCHPFVFGRYMCVLVPPRAAPALARHGGVAQRRFALTPPRASRAPMASARAGGCTTARSRSFLT